MTQNLKQVCIQLADLDDLRSTYKGVGRSHAMALNTLNDLILHSSGAVKRVEKFTEQS